MVAEAFGQIATTTSLVGTVTDASDKPIAECRIRAVNQGSGDTYSVLTSEKGNYNIQFVHVGTYNLTVERSGFQRLEKIGVVVGNNEVVRNDVALAVGVAITLETQASEAAADNITPIWCQRPGSAWQNACTAEAGAGANRSVTRKTTPDVPSDRNASPGAIAPSPIALAAQSPAPPATTISFAMPHRRVNSGARCALISLPSTSRGM